MTQGFQIEKLRRDHPVEGFTCGREELDRFLIRFAFGNQQANAVQLTLVCTRPRLSDSTASSWGKLLIMTRLKDGPEALPAILCQSCYSPVLPSALHCRERLGAGLLKNAMRRTVQAVDIGGIRAFAVHTKNGAARRLYEHFGFCRLQPIPSICPAHENVVAANMRALR